MINNLVAPIYLQALLNDTSGDGAHMEVVGIDTRQVERLARILRGRREKLETLDVFDERFYPPANSDRESVARYFLVVVALDHRLSRPGKPYEACIEDEGCYHGADLLYRLAMKKFMEDPEWYSPEHLASITVDEVREWLTAGDASPPDPEIRALLLRDIGMKLQRLYDGSASKLIDSSNNRLHGTLGEPGLVDRLRVFRAYEDPVEKKPLLLAKFLIARGLFKPVDGLDVAVDNHLTRIALRTGIMMVSGTLWNKIRGGVEVDWEEDVLIRMVARRAYRLLAEKARLDPGVLDDYLWIHGRKTCLRDEEPRCSMCLFRGACLAYRNKTFMVKEHMYYNTWYY